MKPSGFCLYLTFQYMWYGLQITVKSGISWLHINLRKEISRICSLKCRKGPREYWAEAVLWFLSLSPFSVWIRAAIAVLVLSADLIVATWLLLVTRVCPHQTYIQTTTL